MTDSHCHLDPVALGGDEAVDAAIQRAVAAGVHRMITIGAGYGVAGAPRAVAVAERHPTRIRATVGLHPHDAREGDDLSLDALFSLATHPFVVALGEMGLDFHYDFSPRDVQRTMFRLQLKMARRLNRPVVIHDRESEGETLQILDQEAAWDTGVIYHCYTGDAAAMRQITERGGYVSIPGIVTFKNAGTMREVAASCPEDRLLIETDSPFLAPVPHRGKKNEPAFVPLVAAAVAALRGMEPAALTDITDQNAARIFGWPETTA